MYSQELIKQLQAGAICVMPTDTVYGVVGRLDDPEAVAQIYEVKKRDDQKAVGTILAASVEQIRPYVKDQTVLVQAQNYWPGPTSIILPVHERYAYAYRATDGLAFRVPDDPALQALLEKTGPLATSSANLQGFPTAVSVQEAKHYFRKHIALYLDGGERTSGQPSRVMRITPNGAIEIVRGRPTRLSGSSILEKCKQLLFHSKTKTVR